jgi:hypothetical protein
MLGQAAVEVEAASTWAPVNGQEFGRWREATDQWRERTDACETGQDEPNDREESKLDWQTVDRVLRTIAHRRAELDADEAHWLRQAEALQIWRPLGMVSALDYLERVFGYAPRTAQDRLRVARALGSLPQLTAALASGELSFSAVRELTRVATPETEVSWVAAAIGKNVRQIEELVADHRSGDGPDDPPDPTARRHVVRFELSAETFALLRQARTVLDNEHGQNLPEDQFVAALCHAVLDGAPSTEPTGRAKFQIAMTVCERCRQGWQDGAGVKIAVAPATVERAMCDAQHIGSIDGDAPERAYQDIPPSIVRFVWRRDGGRCRIDGCRSARGLEIHHIVHRANGGGDDPSNLVLTCSACHSAHHAGTLTISGTADHLEVRRPAMQHSAAEASTHMGARCKAASVAGARAHMGTRSESHSVATSSVHMGACRESHQVIEANVHMGTRSGPSSEAQAGGHTGAHSKLNATVLRTQSKEALVGLGWKPAIATAAVAAASAAMGTEVTLERLIFEALRRCPRPTT